MIDFITPDTIATEVEMTRAATNNVIVALEGEYDKILFKQYFDLSLTEIIICYGKENAIKAIQLLNVEGKINGYVAIVDSDFNNILDFFSINNVVFSEFHDFEISMIKSDSFLRILEEYATDKIECIKLNGLSIQEYFLHKTYMLSILRFINEKKYKSLCFKE